MAPTGSSRGAFKGFISKAFLYLGIFTALWTSAVLMTGGFTAHLGAFDISSHAARNPAILAVVFLAAAAALATRDEWRRLREHAAPGGAVLAAVFVAGTGLLWGARTAGGADSFGYVSQARLWASGRLAFHQPIADAVRPVSAAMYDATVPLGYRRSPTDPAAIVPTYAPGLPMIMALAERVAGPDAVYAVVPLLGALAIWAAYLLGSSLGGRGAGLTTAVLLATSPPFLYQVMWPMSDVPVAAWWGFALVLAARADERATRAPLAALGAGLAAGAAILTRPNLVPLAIVPGLLLLWHTRLPRAAGEPSSTDLPSPAVRLALFSVGVVPACLLIAYLNDVWYGSPLSNGYGTFDYLYTWAHLGINTRRYGGWLLSAQTPAILAVLAVPLVFWRGLGGPPRPRVKALIAACAGLIALTWLSYVLYLVFDDWWYLRFLLPAFPALFGLFALLLVRVSARVAPRAPALVAAVVVALLAWHGVAYARSHFAFTVGASEGKYEAVGEYVETHLPANAVLISMQHSGSLTFYSDRPTLRYDRLPPDSLDRVVADLGELGYRSYFVLDSWEEEPFRQRFSARSALGRLDWMPLARVDDPRVTIFDPEDQPQGISARRRPDVIPMP